MQRQTSAKSRAKSLRAIRQWRRRHMHDLIHLQHRALCAKLRGHYAYSGIQGNARGLKSMHEEVRREWRKWLSRRCWKGQLFWDQYRQLLKRYPLPSPRLVHRLART